MIKKTIKKVNRYKCFYKFLLLLIRFCEETMSLEKSCQMLKASVFSMKDSSKVLIFNFSETWSVLKARKTEKKGNKQPSSISTHQLPGGVDM